MTCGRRPWTAEEIRTLKAHASELANPYAFEWRRHLPGKDGSQIAGMMRNLGMSIPKGAARARRTDDEICIAFDRWGKRGISPEEACRIYRERGAER